GGDYHYLMRAYGPRIAFIYAWARLAVIQTGSIALLTFIFGDYATRLLDMGPRSTSIYAALAVVVISTLNWAGIRFGTRAQNILTLVEVLGLLLVAVAGLFMA